MARNLVTFTNCTGITKCSVSPMRYPSYSATVTSNHFNYIRTCMRKKMAVFKACTDLFVATNRTYHVSCTTHVYDRDSTKCTELVETQDT